jgi:DNA-binding NtrC family response regulator
MTNGLLSTNEDRSNIRSGMKNKALAYDKFLEALRDSEVDHLRANPVLVISEHEGCGSRVAHALRKRGIDAIVCARLNEARSLLAQKSFSLVCSSDTLPDGDFGLVVTAAGTTPVIAFSRETGSNLYIHGAHRGAIDCMACPSALAEREL